MGSKSLSIRDVWQDRANKDGKNNEKYWIFLMNRYLEEKHFGKYVVSKAEKIKYREDGKYGFMLDSVITNINNGKKKFIENKKQNDAGNAHERAYKYFPGSGIAKRLADAYGITGNPVIVIFSGGMANNEKYVDEIKCQYNDFPNDYFLDTGSVDESIKFIEEVLLPQLE